MSYVTSHWTFNPFLVIVAVLVVANEVGLARLRARSHADRTRRRRLRSLAFYGGLVCLLIAAESPIDYWGYDYFFVHMIEHILISFFAPILVVFGAPWLPLLFSVPLRSRRKLLRLVMLGPLSRPLRAFGRFVRSPWTAFVSFNAAMIFWHLPGPFEAAYDNRSVHIWLMQGSFFVTGVLFWLQIIPSHPARLRASYLWQGGAIIATNVIMFVLAMSLSIFSQASWYPAYSHIPGVSLSPFADQQIGAAILWVCGDFWALPALIVVIRRAIVAEGSLSGMVDQVIRGPTGATAGGLRGR